MWAIKKDSDISHTIHVPLRRNGDWNFWILITADRHFDHPLSDRKMQTRHLEECKQKGGCVIDIGDLFCAMQGRSDSRAMKGSLKEEHASDDYLGELIRDAFYFFKPYASELALLAQGNHESKILKFQELNLTKALIDRLNDNGAQVHYGGYRGWVQIRFVDEGPSRYSQSMRLYYHHGPGSGGPVTRGVINTNRMAVYLPDADIVVTGHLHESWIVEVPRVKISRNGRETVAVQTHLSIPSYKDEFSNVAEGWVHETGKPPKSKGAYWLRFFWQDDRVQMEIQKAN